MNRLALRVLGVVATLAPTLAAAQQALAEAREAGKAPPSWP